MSDDWGTMPGERDWDDPCPFCGCELRAKEIFPDCDDREIYCPDCGYVQGIE
jgi:transcription initiation factor TFIIIB Brf1 subunit/transcription initiation factor TFIIB